MTLSAGVRLGPYEVVGPLGAGGMGEVYRARDPRLGREVAIKVVATEGPASAERLRRFEDEARAVASLSHPNVLAIFDVGERKGKPYVVFELLEGESLRERLRGGPLPLRSAVETAVQVCLGLQAAHSRGILHRDLKPENLFLTSDGFVKILDFGLAKLTRGESAEGGRERTQTAAGVVMGTVGYLSPEQVRARRRTRGRTSSRSGAILYEALSGKRPFSGATAADTISAILNGDPAPLRTASGPPPLAVERIVRRCLAKEREERFHSAHDLALSLEAVLEAPPGLEAFREAEERSPYPGLRSFTEKDAGFFFGREGEVEALWRRLRGRKLLAVIGPSGAGRLRPEGRVIATRPEAGGPRGRRRGRGRPSALRRRSRPTGRGRRGHERPAAGGQRGLGEGRGREGGSAVRRWRAGRRGASRDRPVRGALHAEPEGDAGAVRCAGRPARLGGGRSRRPVSARRLPHPLLGAGPPRARLRVADPLAALAADGLRRALVEPAKKRGYGFEDEALVGEMVEAVEGGAGRAAPAVAVSRLWRSGTGRGDS